MADVMTSDELASHFVHLHNHSHYSLLDGLQKVPEMLDQVKALGMHSVAITDHGTLSGAIEFYNGAKQRELRPIIGMEAYVAPRGLENKNGKVDANPYHLIILASSTEGYHNLLKLSSTAHLEGFYYKPRVDRKLLEQHKEGLVVLSGCLGGEVSQHLLNNNFGQAKEVVEWYRDTFGVDNYYLELQDHEHNWDEQKKVNKLLRKLSAETGVGMVVTADSHYCRPEDREAHEILLCVQTGKTMADEDRMSMEMPLFLSDPKEVAKRWINEPEVILNTGRIAERCQIELQLGGIHIPKFPVPTDQTEREYLHQLTYQGLAWRYGGIPKEDISHYTKEKAIKVVPKEVAERLEFELGVIAKMGYDGYFLIVADFINWGKNQGIIFGPGRGSAAGSIVAYALNITDLDPLQYDLLFERFLNPDRISMPDIDVDMQDTRRQEVIDYVVEKYGEERVAQIITFGTMAARNAVRDTGRALGMSYGEVDAIAKLIPQPIQGRHIPLAISSGIADGKGDQKADPELSNEYKSNPRAKRLIDTAIKLEGTIRSNGVHAAGVVIAPEEIVKYVPLQRAQKGGIVTQYEMNTIENQVGLLKMDFLGLSNLTIINNALRIIKKVYGKNIDTAEIPLDDKATYKMLSRGDTTGVFQLESAGMKRYLRDLKPSAFDDIVAMVALYRPGPMQWIDDFIARKHGRRQIEYIHPAMEHALKVTYGVLVYQEQVMQIAKDMCGFTGGQSDTLRKAIGKKQPETMAKMKLDFIEGAIKTSNADRSLAESFWNNLEDFAAYCFNKSHAACYALIAYQTAYLKAHYPAAFMAALMTSDYGNIDRIAIEVAECKRMGITVLPPDVNESYLEFGVVPEKNQIRFGLSAVKNVGMGAIEAILAAREKEGPFASIEDFARRVSVSEVNRKVWESLIKSGAMDQFGDRVELLHNLDNIMSYAAKAQKNALSGQIDIFGSMGAEDVMPAIYMETPSEATAPSEQLGWEKELLGLYLSRHPLDGYEGFFQKQTQSVASLTPQLEGQRVTIGGIITTMRKITTKNGDTMAFVGLSDKTGDTELIVFPKAYEANVERWVVDNLVKVAGKVNTKDREGKTTSEIKIMVDKVRGLTDRDAAIKYEPEPEVAETVVSDLTPEPALTPDRAKLTIKLSVMAEPSLLNQIKEVLGAHAGEAETYVEIGGDSTKKIRLPFKVKVSDDLLEKLGDLLGQESVVVA